MTMELRTKVNQLAAKGLGWEDICVQLNIRCPEGRALVRKLTLFHVKHRQLIHEEDTPMAS